MLSWASTPLTEFDFTDISLRKHTVINTDQNTRIQKLGIRLSKHSLTAKGTRIRLKELKRKEELTEGTACEVGVEQRVWVVVGEEDIENVLVEIAREERPKAKAVLWWWVFFHISERNADEEARPFSILLLLDQKGRKWRLVLFYFNCDYHYSSSTIRSDRVGIECNPHLSPKNIM